MAVDKLVDSSALDAAITKVANAIKVQSGNYGSMTFPDGMTERVHDIISSGATIVVTNLEPENIVKYENVKVGDNTNSSKYKNVTGTFEPYLTNLAAQNIKTGVTVKVGKSSSYPAFFKTVTGTFTSDATATADDIIDGETAYVNGTKIEGTLDLTQATATAADIIAGQKAYLGKELTTGTLDLTQATATANDIRINTSAYIGKVLTAGTLDPSLPSSYFPLLKETLNASNLISEVTFYGYEIIPAHRLNIAARSSTGATAAYASDVTVTFSSCDNLTEIGDYAFYSSDSYFTRVSSLPDSIKTIGDYAFALSNGTSSSTGPRYNLTIDKFPESLETIGSHAFVGCVGILANAIPESVTSIGAYAFAYAYYASISSVTMLVFKGTPTSIVIASNAFNMCRNITDVYVPWASGVVSNEPWGFTASNQTIHYNVTDYSSETTYDVNSYCRSNDHVWKCLTSCEGVAPTEGTYWTDMGGYQ